MAAPSPDGEPSWREQRAEARRPVDQVPQGRVTLRTRGREEPVRRIRDLSDHGLCLVLDHALEPGEPVMLLHEGRRAAAAAEASPKPTGIAATQEDLLAPPHAYRGYVVWCRALDDAAGVSCATSTPVPRYLAGLRVHDPYTLDHLLAPASH